MLLGNLILWGYIIFAIFILFYGGITHIWSRLIYFIPGSAIFVLSANIVGKKIEENDRNWGLGFEAELIVGTKLAAIGNDFKVIQDLLKGDNTGNIDHIVIGPTGVFVVETKANREWMVIFRKDKNVFSERADKFIKQAAGNAFWAHKIIKEKLDIDIFVQGLVVRPFNKCQRIKNIGSNSVRILDGDSCYNYIKDCPCKLNNNEIEKINNIFCEIKRQNRI